MSWDEASEEVVGVPSFLATQPMEPRHATKAVAMAKRRSGARHAAPDGRSSLTRVPFFSWKLPGEGQRAIQREVRNFRPSCVGVGEAGCATGAGGAGRTASASGEEAGEAIDAAAGGEFADARVGWMACLGSTA